MTPGRIVALVLVLVVAGLGFVNYAVNAETQVNLLFKVPLVGAWALGEAMSLPILLAITFLVGFVAAGLGFGVKLAGSSRRLRNLRRQVAALQEELDYNRRTAREAAPAAASPSPVSTSAPVISSPPPVASSDFDDLI